MSDRFPWLALLVLGAVHGVNPAMGWLFAVGRALQEQRRRGVWSALAPLALGHACAIAVVVALAVMLGEVLPARGLRWFVAALLVGFGIDGLLHHRHVSLRGMRVNARELATWSFLMATVHGAGLMVLPFMLGANSRAPTMTGAMSMHHHHDAAVAIAGMAALDWRTLGAPLVHTAGYVVMTAALAFVVYEKLGVRILRRAWINVNVLWSAALIAAGMLALAA